MAETLDHFKACAIMGHRLEKLGIKNENDKQCIKIKRALFKAILYLEQIGVTHFITGGEQGVDIWAAEMVIQLMCAEPEADIRLLCYIAYEGQADHWFSSEYRRYKNMLGYCTGTKVMHPGYVQGCYRDRNMQMMNDSGYLIAVYDNAQAKSGTGHVIRLAKEQGKTIVYIDPFTAQIKTELNKKKCAE